MDLSRRIPIAAWLFVCAHACYAGEIEGVVRLSGPIPVPAIVTLQADSKGAAECGSLTRSSHRWRVNAEGGVADAVVWVDLPASAANNASAPGDVVIDQIDCEYTPHVVVVPPGGQVVVRNSDAVLHNLRMFQDNARVVEEWQRPRAEALTMHLPAGKAGLPAPERYLLRCGVHSWMYAWVIAAAHPAYAVTDQAGRFHLTGIHPGRHTMHVWHETFSGATQTIQVGARTARVTISVENQQEGG